MTASRPPVTARPLGELQLTELLDALEAPAPSPCGGSAAGIAGAMAAALVALVARRSVEWADAAGVAAQAVALRARLEDLATEDVRAYAAATEALASVGESGGARDRMLAVALTHAADVPLAIASDCADVAELASLAAAEGAAPLRPDAVAATVLAEAACRASAHLVTVNLTALPGDEHSARAVEHAEAARLARDRALAAA